MDGRLPWVGRSVYGFCRELVGTRISGDREFEVRLAELGGPFFQVGKLGLETGEFGEMRWPVGVDFGEAVEGLCLRGVEIGEGGVEGLCLRGVFACQQCAGEGRGRAALPGEEARGGLARGGGSHETVGQRRGNWAGLREEFGGFQFE